MNHALRLYISGLNDNSVRAIKNLREVCIHLENKISFEVVDVTERPDLAERDRIMVTPTLMTLSPLTEARLVGNLSDTNAVLRCLGVKEPETKN